MSEPIDRLQLGKDIANATHTAKQALHAAADAAKSSADNSVKLDLLAVQFDQFLKSVDDLKRKVDHINGVDEKLAAQGFFTGTAEQNKRIMSFLRWISRYPKLAITIIGVLAAAVLGESTVDLARQFRGFFK